MSRTWILQELVFAQEIIFYWNRCSMTDENLSDYIKEVMDAGRVRQSLLQDLRGGKAVKYGLDMDDADSVNFQEDWTQKLQESAAYAHFRRISQLHKRYAKESLDENLISLVHEFRHTEQSDFHDRVYALLTLERRSKVDGVVHADYRTTLAELFITILSKRSCTDIKALNLWPSDLPQLPEGCSWRFTGPGQSTGLYSLLTTKAWEAYALLRARHLGTTDMIEAIERLDALADTKDLCQGAVTATAEAVLLVMYNRTSEPRTGISTKRLKTMAAEKLPSSYSRDFWTKCVNRRFVDDGSRYRPLAAVEVFLDEQIPTETEAREFRESYVTPYKLEYL